MSDKKFTALSLDFYNSLSHLQKPPLGQIGILEDNIFPKIKSFLLGSVANYSNIGTWWEKVVKTGLLSGERVCNVIYDQDEIVALSIGKRHTKSSKLCTLKVSKEYRSHGLGNKLLAKTIPQIVGKGCKKVHFTIGDEVQDQVGNFFSNYGFNLTSWKKDFYSKGHEEFVYSADTRILNYNLKKTKMIPNHCLPQFLISVKPKYAELIEDGSKTVELRKRFSFHSNPTKAFFYVSAPSSEIRFSAIIEEIVKSSPSSLWEKFANECGIDFSSFEHYFSNSEFGYALKLAQVIKLTAPLKLHDTQLKAIHFRPPQSYAKLSTGSQISDLLKDFSV